MCIETATWLVSGVILVLGLNPEGLASVFTSRWRLCFTSFQQKVFTQCPTTQACCSILLLWWTFHHTGWFFFFFFFWSSLCPTWWWRHHCHLWSITATESPPTKSATIWRCRTGEWRSAAVDRDWRRSGFSWWYGDQVLSKLCDDSVCSSLILTCSCVFMSSGTCRPLQSHHSSASG